MGNIQLGFKGTKRKILEIKGYWQILQESQF